MNLSSNQTDTKTDTRFLIVRGILLISVLLIFLVVLTLWGEAIDIDRRFSAQFFTTGDDWFLADIFPWNWLYDFGEAPGILFSILCFTCWIFFRTDPARAALRPYLLICALTPTEVKQPTSVPAYSITVIVFVSLFIHNIPVY